MRRNVQKYQQLSDEELVKGIVSSRDEQMFAVLYDRYAKVIYNKGLQFLGSEEAAKDTTHDIFLNLFLKLNTFKGQSRFSTWLYSFVYHFYINYVNRQLKKEKELFVDKDPDLEHYRTVTDEELFTLRSEKLARVLDQLNSTDKAILLMKYQDDFSIKELQEVFNISESAVKMRINRAKARVIQKYNAS